MLQDEQGEWWKPDLSHFQTCGSDFKKTVGMGIKSGNLAPSIVIGVFAAPVMVLATDPVVHLDRFPVDHERSLVGCQTCLSDLHLERRRTKRTIGERDDLLHSNMVVSFSVEVDSPQFTNSSFGML